MLNLAVKKTIPEAKPQAKDAVKDDSSRQKPTGEKDAQVVQLSKTALKVRTKLHETVVTSLADLVPTLKEVSMVTNETEETGRSSKLR